MLKAYRCEADVTVDAHGRGDYLDLQSALAAIDLSKPVTIQLLGGEWERPQLPKKSNVKFILRQGAVWK